MAFDGRRGDGGPSEIARGCAMPNSSATDVVFLPFGSLTGVIPIDAVRQERVLGDLSNVLSGEGRRATEIQQQIHSVIDPVPIVPRSRRLPENGGGGI